jgi:hypothetical protein
VIQWSNNLVSDSIILILEEIMNKERIFTIWEKTGMFSGYLKTIFFTLKAFTTDSDSISRILASGIDCIVELVMPEKQTTNLIKTIDEYIFVKKHPEISIIRCRYPFKADIKIGLFGRKTLAKKIKRQLHHFVSKHTIHVHRMQLSFSQVSVVSKYPE